MTKKNRIAYIFGILAAAFGYVACFCLDNDTIFVAAAMLSSAGACVCLGIKDKQPSTNRKDRFRMSKKIRLACFFEVLAVVFASTSYPCGNATVYLLKTGISLTFTITACVLTCLKDKKATEADNTMNKGTKLACAFGMVAIVLISFAFPCRDSIVLYRFIMGTSLACTMAAVSLGYLSGKRC